MTKINHLLTWCFHFFQIVIITGWKILCEIQGRNRTRKGYGPPRGLKPAVALQLHLQGMWPRHNLVDHQADHWLRRRGIYCYIDILVGVASTASAAKLNKRTVGPVGYQFDETVSFRRSRNPLWISRFFNDRISESVFATLTVNKVTMVLPCFVVYGASPRAIGREVPE